MKIGLTQRLIRLIFVPMNLAVLIAMIITTAIPYAKIPDMKYTSFVFWLLKPTLLVELILSVCVFVLGFTGATKFNRCWQVSFSCFVLSLVVIGILSVAFCDRIPHEIDTIIVSLSQQNQFVAEINEVYQELECEQWEDDPIIGAGCRSKIISSVGDYPQFARPYTIASLIILIISSIFNFVFAILVDPVQENTDKIVDDD